MLPSEEARRQVLLCLTDRENYARVHQGLLLACLRAKGFPEGYDPGYWWKQHAVLFVPSHDPDEAARLVWGWSEKAEHILPENPSSVFDEVVRQKKAAWYHERGASAVDEQFAKAYWRVGSELDVSKQNNEEVTEPALGVHRIAWW